MIGDQHRVQAPRREHDACDDAGDREQRAVREIENAHDAVDQRQSERDQRIEPPQQDAADQQLDDDSRHAGDRRVGEATSPLGAAPIRRDTSVRQMPLSARSATARSSCRWLARCGHTTTGSPFCI